MEGRGKITSFVLELATVLLALLKGALLTKAQLWQLKPDLQPAQAFLELQEPGCHGRPSLWGPSRDAVSNQPFSELIDLDLC